MEIFEAPQTFTATVFTRHLPTCKDRKKGGVHRKCGCPKYIYLYEDGKDRMVSAKTRSWERAEEFAQVQRDMRDPLKRKLREIEERERREAELREAENKPVSYVCDRWLDSHKGQHPGTAKIYKRAAQRIKNWAEVEGIKGIRDVTHDQLDGWRSKWGEDAKRELDRIGATSQSQFIGYLKQVFAYALKLGWVERDHALGLPTVEPSGKRTEVLTPAQFRLLLDVIEPACAAQTNMVKGLARELKALFLLQRWSGLRIVDALMLPRSGLTGSRMQTVTQKTGKEVDCMLPDHVVDALRALAPDRPGFKPGYFFWHDGIPANGLSTKWDDHIRLLRPFLHFVNDEGRKWNFHSQALRDTYAVELLLAGVPLDKVSRLLTHASTRTTELYYARWTKGRTDQLRDEAMEAMQKMGATFSASSAASVATAAAS
jgi:integrase/recombinase XerD